MVFCALQLSACGCCHTGLVAVFWQNRQHLLSIIQYFSLLKFFFEAQAQFSVNGGILTAALLHGFNHVLTSIFLIVIFFEKESEIFQI